MNNKGNHNSQFSTLNSQFSTLNSQLSTLNSQLFFAFKSKKNEFRFVNSNIICTFALAK